MELIKKNIHMDRVRLQAGTQITLEDDRNIPDAKPDVSGIIYETGKVKVEEVKPVNDHVNVKGRLEFTILYQTPENEVGVASVTGEIPFAEQVFMDQVTSSDLVDVNVGLEDLRVSMINSRKLNIQAVIAMELKTDELYEEEVAVDIYGSEALEYRKQPFTLSQLAIRKNDIFRMKEEISLPSNYPNIFEIILSHVALNDVEFKVMDEKISIQGDLQLFVLYEGEGEERPIRAFESVIPISGTYECHGCREDMLPDIRYEMGHLDIDVRPDLDGEERVIGIEAVLDIMMRLYEEEKVELLTDVYGVTSEVDTQLKMAEFKQVLARNAGKCKAVEHIKISPSETRVLQVIHAEGNVEIDSAQIVEDGIQIEGSIAVKVLYVTGDDTTPYGSLRRQIPFSYTLEIPGIEQQDSFYMNPELEKLTVTMLDSEELDVKGVIGLKAIVFRRLMEEMIDRITVGELDGNKIHELPGIVVYTVQPGDSLWKIGKRYYVSVEAIKEMNRLTSDEIRPGDKLLLVKYPNGDS